MAESGKKLLNRRAIRAALRYVNLTNVLTGLFVGSLVLILAMVIRLERIEAALSPPTLATVGTTVLPVNAREVDGEPIIVPIGHTRKPVVLYIFSPTCGWCARNLKNIHALSSERGGQFAFVGISLSSTGLKSYANAANLPFPLYAISTSRDVHPLVLNSTPETIVIAPNGRVVKSWMGAYVGTTQAEVQNYFDIHLPGLTNQSTADPR